MSEAWTQLETEGMCTLLAHSLQVDGGHDYFHWSPLLSPEVVTIFSLCMLGFLVFLIVESLPLVSSLVLSIHDFFS